MGNNMDRTLEYYSMWLGKEGILKKDNERIVFIYSAERNNTQYGYGQPFDLYIFCYGEKIIVSYGDKAADKIDYLKQNITASADEIKGLAKSCYGKVVNHNIKYVFHGSMEDGEPAKILTCADYKKYEDFFKCCNPNCTNIDWLGEYFEEMNQENMCVGVFVDGKLVCCTDAPGMPYMSDKVQEIGINTLMEYRGNGYAAAACAKCIKEIMKNGKVPQWSTDINNIASKRLAERIGFVKLADVITVTL